MSKSSRSTRHPSLPLENPSPSPLHTSNGQPEGWDRDLLIRPIWEVIQPTHWFTFSSSKRHDLTDLVNLAGRILYALVKRHPGLRFLVIGSTNNGTKRPHLHGFLHVPQQNRVLINRLLRGWKRGRMKHLKVFDPERDAIAYVTSQVEEGEILWCDGQTPEPIRRPYRRGPVKATPARVGRERRLFYRSLRAIEDLDRIKRHQRRERLRERQRKAKGPRATISAPPVNIVVSIAGLRPLDLPLKCLAGVLPHFKHPTPINWEELRRHLNGGGWSLPTVAYAGEHLGLSPDGVRAWLGLRKVARRLDGSQPMRSPNPVFVDDSRELALVLLPRALELAPRGSPALRGTYEFPCGPLSCTSDPSASRTERRRGMRL